MLEWREVFFRYHPEAPWVFHGKSFSFHKGRSYFLVGPSGSGKTTFFQLCCGLLTPNQGDILWYGESIAKRLEKDRAKWRAREVGVVFQDFQLFPQLTVWENILLPSQLFPSGEALSTMEESAKNLLKTLGLEGLLSRRAKNLSQGQKQRVALIRCLLRNSSLILADEPVSSVQDQMARKMMELLLERAQALRAILIVSSHDRRWESLFDQKISLDEVSWG